MCFLKSKKKSFQFNNAWKLASFLSPYSACYKNTTHQNGKKKKNNKK